MIDIETARGYYIENDSAHGFDHVLRVWRLAERIGLAARADMRVLRAAALLHDIGRAEEQRSGRCHAEVGAERAAEILADKPRELVARAAEAIAQHRFRGDRGPSSLEAQVLYDADKLDAIGAIGIARAYAIAGATRQRLWADVSAAYAERPATAGRDDQDNGTHTPVHEYRFKLVKLRDRMHTTTGREIAEARHAFMVSFFHRLGREVNGKV